VIAVDTNLLVYAHRQDSPFHAAAQAALIQLGLSKRQWAIPWPCIHEFISIVTGPAFKQNPTPLEQALDAVRAWIEHPHCSLLCETRNHFGLLSGLSQRAKIRGGAIHDARIAAICIEHQVEEFWTLDRDFQAYPDLRTRNPLIASLHEPVAVYQRS
jgi:uncharacterized protein